MSNLAAYYDARDRVADLGDPGRLDGFFGAALHELAATVEPAVFAAAVSMAADLATTDGIARVLAGQGAGQ